MAFDRNIWILVRLGGLGALGAAGILWIVYMAIGPAAESELETVNVQVVRHWFNRHKGRIVSQDISVRNADGEDVRYKLPFWGRDQRKIEVGEDMRVTLKVTEYGNVYAVEGRRGTLMTYQEGRDWHSSRRIIPGLLATTMSVLAVVLAMLSFFGPMLVKSESESAASR